MAGMLINALYNLADTYFVGGLGSDQMGAVTVAYPLGQVVVGLGLLFGNGAAAYLSRLLGKGDRETADQVASTALYGSVFSGAALIFAVVIFLKPILGLLGAIDSVMPYALAYTRIYIVFSIFNVFNVTMNNIVSSEGAAKEGCFLGACRQGFCFVPMILLLPGVFGLQGILFAQPAADVLAAVITVFMAWDVHRKLWDTDKAG